MAFHYTAYFIQGFLRQPNRAKAREYLGITEGDDTASTPVPPGSGDFVGPAGSVAGNFVSFADATGKLGADSGSSPANMPTANQKAALAGTDGAPSAANEYVTDSDPRNANARTPSAHATTHQNGGADEVSVAGLSGVLADPQTPAAHAASHSDGGSDPVDVTDLAGFSGVATDVLLGNATFGPSPGGGGSGWDVELVKPSDQTVTNDAAPQNDTFLFTTLAANTFYLIELQLIYSGNNTTGDYRGRFTFPTAAPGGVIGTWLGFSTAGAALLTPAGQASLTQWPTGDILLFADIEANLRTCLVRFQLVTAGAGGTLQYQFANNSAAAGRTSTTRAGTVLRLQILSP